MSLMLGWACSCLSGWRWPIGLFAKPSPRQTEAQFREAMQMAADQFGVFSPVFESEPGYLDFLNLGSRVAKQTVSLVAECCRKSADPYPEIGRLLDENNWRFHIVAAVALSVLGFDGPTLTKLWGAFDAGSWVTPQLAVAAYLRDPGFSENARARIESRCPVNPLRLISMSPVERHVSAGPAGVTHRAAKAAACLIFLAGLNGQVEWLTSELSSPDLVALLSEDIDRADIIAQRWLAQLKGALTALAIKID